MEKATNDRQLMHQWTPRDSSLGPGAQCELCGTWWLTTLRAYNYNGHRAAIEMCRMRDPDRHIHQMPTSRDVVATIHQLQDEMHPR